MSGIFQDAVFGGLFGDPEAMALWSAEAQLERFRTVEAALSKALAEVGLVAQFFNGLGGNLGHEKNPG